MTQPSSQRSFLGHAKLIGALTLLSRLGGLAREVVASHFLGTGIVASAFAVAFTIPNLFRKLLGEGALSAAFIPLYAQANKRGVTETGEPAGDFASGSVNLLVLILVSITVVGEAFLGLAIWSQADESRVDRLLMLQFAAVMLPYVLLVCGGAFLSAILQVHKRFGPPAFAPVLLNVCHIAVVAGGAWWLGLRGKDDPTAPAVIALQTRLAFMLAVTVLIAGVLQVMVLLPALKQSGFRFRPRVAFWTPATRKMLLLSVPVAMGAGVLQLSVLLDKLISYSLMQGVDAANQLITHFTLLGRTIEYPMLLGATVRLDRAQLLYQFPLGVFAIALATAIFPHLSADAMDAGREQFRRTLRQGIGATLWEGLPASVGLILIREPLARLLFQHGQTTAADASLIADSLFYYAAAIWAFGMIQLINRAYYAIHDTLTPLIASVVNIVLNLVVELPLIWFIGEAGMAVGTMVSFSVQAIVMLWLLDRRLGGIGMGELLRSAGRMLIATAVMGLVCLAAMRLPIWPTGDTRGVWLTQMTVLVAVGAATYLGVCSMLGVNLMARLRRR